MTPRRVVVMADYHAFPIWERTPGRPPGGLSPSSLPLSRQLVSDLLSWNDTYGEDGSQSFFQRMKAERDFRREGLALVERVQHELGPDFVVGYGP